MFKIVFLTFISIQAVFGKTSNFKYKKDGALQVSHDQYLTSSKCVTAVQCSVACTLTPGCFLADLDSGNLFIRAQAHTNKIQQIRNYVESKENNFDESGQEFKHDESFLIISTDGGKARDVYEVSMKSKTKQKTGIVVTDTIRSIVYDRKSNTFFWSVKKGIYKQVMEAGSKQKKTCRQEQVDFLNIYNSNVFYSFSSHGIGQIHYHNPKEAYSNYLWLTVKKTIVYKFVIDSNIGCWIGRFKAVYSVSCVDMSTKSKIFTYKEIGGTRLHELALCKTADFGMIVYVAMKEVRYGYRVKVVEITAGGQFGKPETATVLENIKKTLHVFPGLLLYSFNWQNKVEIRELSQNGSVGKVIFSTSYPSSSKGTKVLVTRL